MWSSPSKEERISGGTGRRVQECLLVLADPTAGRRKGEAAAAARRVRVGGPGVQATVEGTRFATTDSRTPRQVSLMVQSIVRHNRDPRESPPNRQSRFAQASGPLIIFGTGLAANCRTFRADAEDVGLAPTGVKGRCPQRGERSDPSWGEFQTHQSQPYQRACDKEEGVGRGGDHGQGRVGMDSTPSSQKERAQSPDTR